MTKTDKYSQARVPSLAQAMTDYQWSVCRSHHMAYSKVICCHTFIMKRQMNVVMVPTNTCFSLTLFPSIFCHSKPCKIMLPKFVMFSRFYLFGGLNYYNKENQHIQKQHISIDSLPQMSEILLPNLMRIWQSHSKPPPPSTYTSSSALFTKFFTRIITIYLPQKILSNGANHALQAFSCMMVNRSFSQFNNLYILCSF